jgi:hypothetical protein
VNGPCVRANRASTFTSASGTSARNASGSPPGGTAPERVAVQPASSAAIHRSSRAIAQRDRPPLPLEVAQHRRGVEPGHDARDDLVERQVADPAQHVAEGVDRLGPRPRRAVLQVVLDRLQRVGVDEVAQLVLAEQLAQEVAVERERAARRSAFGVSPSYMYVAT